MTSRRRRLTGGASAALLLTLAAIAHPQTAPRFSTADIVAVTKLEDLEDVSPRELVEMALTD